MGRPSKDVRREVLGKVYPTKNWGDVLVTDYVSFTEVYIKFLNSGYEKTSTMRYIRNGTVQDDSQIKLFGVGIFEKGKHAGYIKKTPTKVYRVWSKMLERCYVDNTDSFSRYKGRGVTVHPDWHYFQNFAEWFSERYREGYEIDKDIIQQGNKVYGPDTCCMVPSEINQLVIYKPKLSGLPTGVEKKKSKYATEIYRNKVREKLGTYETPEEAFQVYKREKEKFIQQTAAEYYDAGKITKEVCDALMRWEILPYPQK